VAREVLLVNSNRLRPRIAPLALEYLADALDAAGVPWRVLDLAFAEDPVAALREGMAGADLRLIAVTFRNTDDCFGATQHSFIADLRALIREVRAQSDAPIVLGGAGFSVAPEGLLRRTGADFGVVGDGEGPLVRLTQSLDNEAAWPAIPGLLARRGDEVAGERPEWSPVAQDPLPRTALDNARYFAEGGQLGIETKRGCPAGCVYCADGHSKGSRVRPRPPVAVAQEMLGLATRGLDVFHTCDSEFNCDPAHALAVCEELASRGAAEKLRWYAYCSPTPFGPELARAMSEAGCVGVNFGADSGDPEMLDRLGREHTPEDIHACVEACHAAGLVVMLDLLLGGPGETPESLGRSVEVVRASRADCAGAALGVRLYPNTPLSRSLLEKGSRKGLHGHLEENEDLALPLFYIDPALGKDPVAAVKAAIAGDQRFFFGWPDDTQADYNYDDNPELVEAIRDGERGAYWDILRKRRGL